jgi:hypothetical protein
MFLSLFLFVSFSKNIHNKEHTKHVYEEQKRTTIINDTHQYLAHKWIMLCFEHVVSFHR